MTSDLDLLRRFTREDSQEAFGEIVRRHLNLVYSAALRQVRSPQLAEDVAQSVFADLAREARTLKPDTVLTAWLYAVARRTAIDTVRKESRRQLREQIAVEMNTMNATADDWKQIAPLLDDAMAALDEADRTAILLRYFENKSLRDVGGSLNISDDAAQKRVSRAVERLREFFSKERVAIGAGGLVALISANAVQSAPTGLPGMILSGTFATTSTIGIAMIHKILIAGMTAAVVGTGIYAVHLQGQIGALQRQQTSLNNQITQLQQERDDAANRLQDLQQENELLRTEAETSRLGNEVARNEATPAPVTNISVWQNWNNNQLIGSFYAVAGTANETVAVGIGGHIATRDNSTGVWKLQTSDQKRDFRAVIYADGQYVAVSEGGFIMTSPDGLQWTSQSSPTKTNLLGVFWDGRQYLAGGDGEIILSSPDGVNWTIENSGGRISLYSFGYSGARYVAVGNDGILVSSDSVKWTRVMTAPPIPFTACTWTGSEFLACGLGLDQNPTIYTSPDGGTWTLRDTTITASLRAAITVNNAIYVSGDSDIEESMDGGTTWTNTFTNPKGGELFMGMAYNGESLIAAGFNHNVWATPVQ